MKTFTELDELIKEFQRHPQLSYARLRLDHYLVLRPTNEAGDHFLYGLRLQEILPFTATWFYETDWRASLYQNPFEGRDWSYIAANFFGLQFRFGSGEYCIVPNGAYSHLRYEVAALPEETLMLFSQLSSLADHMIAYLDAPLELGPEAWCYRQIT